MKHLLTIAFLIALSGIVYADELSNALTQLERADERLSNAEEADKAKLLLKPDISDDFRAAKADAKEVKRKADEMAGPENAFDSILGTLGQVLGIGGPIGLLTAGGMFGVGRMRRRNKLHQLARDQGVDPHDQKYRGVDEFEMMVRLAQAKAANGSGNGSGRHKSVVPQTYAGSASTSGEYKLP